MSLTSLNNFGVKSELTTGFPESLQHLEFFENIGTAIGFQALEYNLLGVLNTAVGYQAIGAESAFSGDGLTAVGTQTLFNNNGNFNTGTGARAGYSNSAGTRNSYYGYTAGYYNKSGNDQTYLGYAAGENALGDKNVFVGSSSGGSASSTSNNIGVGANANATGGGSVSIGTGAAVSGNNTIAIGGNSEVSGENSFVVGPNITSQGDRSLILMPRQDGLPFSSTKDETLNVYNRLLGEREITGNYKVSLLGDRILLDNSFNRVNLDSSGMSFYSDSTVTFLSPTNFVAPANFVTGSANFNVPATFDGLTNVNGPANLYNVHHANACNLFVRNTIVSDGNAMFNSNVSLFGKTFATNLTATDADVSSAYINVLNGNQADFEDVDTEIATIDKLTVTESTALAGTFSLSNFAGAAQITNDLAVGETTTTKNLHVSSGDLSIARLSITDSVDVNGTFSLSNVEKGVVGGSFEIGESLAVGSNVDVGSNIYFRNALDPAGVSSWGIGLHNPYPNSPELADLVLRSSDTTEVRFTQDFSAGIMNFTGSHTAAHAIREEDVADCVGKIVVASGEYEGLDGKGAIEMDEAIPVVRLAEGACDPAVFGVVSSVEDGHARDHVFRLGNLMFNRRKARPGARVRVNSVGEGCVLVCECNGPLRNGDLIVSSHVPGIGMRQDDDVIRNFTVAKITQDCYFGEAGVLAHDGSLFRFQLVGCVYKM